jgi:predicted LPLAT superfamily acyltransferase
MPPTTATTPTKSAPRHWAAINELGFVNGMRLLFWIGRVGGRWPFRLVLYPVLAWYWLTKPAARRASGDYLRRIKAHVGSSAAGVPMPSGALGVLRHFAAFGENILDKMLLWGGLYDTGAVQFSGGDQVRACLASGQGALLICSHLGNLELCRVLSTQRSGLKLTVLVHTKHAQAFNRMLAQLDPRSELDLLQVTEMTPATAMLLSERIAQGQFVVIAGDRVPVGLEVRAAGSAGSATAASVPAQSRVVQASFLGQEAAFPVGPYVLASVLQCPIYMLFSMRGARGPEVHFELLRASFRLPRKARAGHIGADPRAAALSAVATDYAARLQHHCARAPLQWFNFYDFWQAPALK